MKQHRVMKKWNYWLARLNKTEVASKLKSQFSSLKTKESIIAMQKFISTYQSHVIPKINRLMLMYELWTIEYLSKIEPIAKDELKRLKEELEAGIKPRFDSLLNVFAEGRKKNKDLRDKIHYINTHPQRSFYRASSSLSATNQINIQKKLDEFSEEKNSIRLNEFSEEFCDLRELFVSLPIHFEVAKGATSFSPNPELLLKIEAYIKDELTFHLTDKFKDLVEELKNYGVSIRDNSGGGYRRLNLTWEK